MPKPRDPNRIRYENNYKAIRFGKKEFTTNLINKKLYDSWIKSSGYEVTYLQFKELWYRIADTIINHVVTTPEGVVLPFNIGNLISKFVDFEHYDNKILDERKKVVPNLNLHSNGKAGKLVFSVHNARKKNKASLLYGFKGHPNFVKRVRYGFETTPEYYKDYRMTSAKALHLLHKKHGTTKHDKTRNIAPKGRD